MAALTAHDRRLPGFVDRELRAYLACGDPARGFAWLECVGCAHHRLVPFSCKTRGFCPACAGRRMAEGAAEWVDRVIPHVATRQFVLTVPWRRRWLLARRPDLAAGILRIALRRIERFYRRATGRTRGRSGGVTVIQRRARRCESYGRIRSFVASRRRGRKPRRNGSFVGVVRRFGSALNLNLHVHVVHQDGVFDRGADDRLRFFQATPTTADVEDLVVEIGTACEAWLGAEADDEDTAEVEDDVQGVLQFASLAGTHALGERARHAVRRVVTLGGRPFALPPRCASFAGYNLHANVSLAATDRGGLERLCRYVLRPPLAMDRFQRLSDGRVRVGMKRVWSDGTAAIELSPLELVEKLAALIPPPRVNQIRYHGVLAGNAAWRAEVVPKVPSSGAAEEEARRARRLSKRHGPRIGRDTPGWADLLWRVFQVDGWACPSCGGRMRLRMVVDLAPAARRIATGLLRSRGPPDAVRPGEDQGAGAGA